ncbi:hypothetical protein E9998_00605 [Glycomyces paridis]|uniref:NADH:quinone oxidoreductase/Mrp antiporter transmembrane domain-containing protein n=2 Tax=Glycomyces paridis TaxID=2126555 RepID=A0A4S8PWZ3_9ACTN|nr:hypothetical protein E9998_00605 [Glycomyces paridis]
MTAAGRTDATAAASAAFAYAVFFVLLEAGAFTALTAVRPGDADAGGDDGTLRMQSGQATGAVRPGVTEVHSASDAAPLKAGMPDAEASGTGADVSIRTSGFADTDYREGPSRAVVEVSAASAAERRTSRAPLESGGPPRSDLSRTATGGGVHVPRDGGTIQVPGEGGRIAELSGLRKSAPLPASVLVLAVVGLAGLPPALAGTFAKVAVLEVLASSAVWLAVVVAAGAVVGLAYYLPLARTVLLGRAAATGKGRFALEVTLVGLALAAVSLAPRLVLEFTTFTQ